MSNGASITYTHDIESVTAVDAIYADTWISMGDGAKLEDIIEKFKPYQVTTELMNKVNAKYFMHCQPAHRDEEVTGEVLDSGTVHHFTPSRKQNVGTKRPTTQLISEINRIN